MRDYLDHNATSPLTEVARAAIEAAWALGPLNPGSVHAEGQRARAALERARRAVSRALGQSGGQVVFLSGATEANHLVVGGLKRAGTIASSATEHASLLGAIEQAGRVHAPLAVDREGRIALESLDAALSTGQVAMVSVMAANNELGTLQDLPRIAARCVAAGVPLHIDAAQVVGRLPWTPPAGVAAITVSAHKAGGPPGVGALWLAAPHDWNPVQTGGAQERGMRAGTEPLALAVGMAAVLASVDPRWASLGAVRDALEAALEERLGLVRVVPTAERLPNTLSLSLPGGVAEEIVQALDLAGVAASAGAACSAGSTDPSHVIQALGLPNNVASGVFRLSLGPEHVDLNVDALVGRMVAALEGLAG